MTGEAPEPGILRTLLAIGLGILNSEAPRLAAVFMLATSSLGRRSGAFPRWLVLIGLVLGLVMIANVTVAEPIPWLFPTWVSIVSITLLFRHETAQRGFERGEEGPGDGPLLPGSSETSESS